MHKLSSLAPEEWRSSLQSIPDGEQEKRRTLEKEFYEKTATPIEKSINETWIQFKTVLWKSIGSGCRLDMR